MPFPWSTIPNTLAALNRLRFINKPGHQQAVLELITSKTPMLEDPQSVLERIREARQYVSLDQLCLSP